MKTKYLGIIIYLFILVGLSTSCEDTRLNEVVDDKIYALKPAYNEAVLFNWGEYEYPITVMKSGVGKQSSEVELLLDEAYLEKYNAEHSTTYKLLPTDCYRLNMTKLTMGKETYTSEFPILFATEKISELQGIGNVEYVLPFKLVVGNEQIAAGADRLSMLIVPKVQEAYLMFKNPGKALSNITLTPNSIARSKQLSTVRTNYNNRCDLTYQVDVVPSLVDDYNQLVGAGELNYEMLPEGAYEIVTSHFKMRPLQNESKFDFYILKDALQKDGKHLFGNYMLPLQITSVSNNKVAPYSQSIQLITVTYEAEPFDKSSWEVIRFTSDEEGDGNGVDALIDGNEDTFWHSQWKDKGDGIPAMPHTMVIDMKKEYDIMSLEVVRRNYNTDTKKVEFEVSVDDVDYAYLTNIDFGKAEENNARNASASVKTTKARYLRLKVTESNRAPHCSISEIYVKGIE